ncbi:hypothetical protein GE21DRAFT_1211355 [Neurospora crassa]|nr:hypothetical protein GE21DRAFT_1211355 [Neurospora crassa]
MAAMRFSCRVGSESVSPTACFPLHRREFMYLSWAYLTYTDHAVLATPTGCSHGAGYTTYASSFFLLHFQEQNQSIESTRGHQMHHCQLAQILPSYRNPC